MSVIQGNVKLTADFLHRLGLPWSIAVPVGAQLNYAFGNGTGDDQIDAYGKFSLSIPAGNTVAVNMDALTDATPEASGNVSLQEVRVIILFAPSTNDDAVHFEQGTVNPWTTGALKGTAPEIPIDIRGSLLFIAPKDGRWTVAGGSKQIDFTNQSGAQTNRVEGLILGKAT